MICSSNKQNATVKELSAPSCVLVMPAARLRKGAGLLASTANCRAGASIHPSPAELTAELKLSATIFNLITHGHSNPAHVIEIAALRQLIVGSSGQRRGFFVLFMYKSSKCIYHSVWVITVKRCSCVVVSFPCSKENTGKFQEEGEKSEKTINCI